MEFPKRGLQGVAKPSDFSGEYNSMLFVIRQVLSKVNVAALVEVIKVTGGGESSVGFVDVQPLVDQVDGFGNGIAQGILHNIPYMRMQGGASAVILDPVKGDIGIAVFADRDISTAKKPTQGSDPAVNRVTPGSRRRFDVADGLYLGGVLNGAPTQFVEFTNTGIKVKSTNTVTIAAPSIKLENAGSALHTLLNSTLLTWLEAHVHTDTTTAGVTGIPTTTPPSTVATTITQAE